MNLPAGVLSGADAHEGIAVGIRVRVRSHGANPVDLDTLELIANRTNGT